MASGVITGDGHMHQDVVVREVAEKGLGVFGLKPFPEGALVVAGKPVETSSARSWNTIQVGVNAHVVPDAPLFFVNHSCEPNCGIRGNDFGGYDLIAMETIAEGEEITFDYCMCEWDVVGFQACECGCGGCRGAVAGARHLSQDFFERYAGFLAPYFENIR